MADIIYMVSNELEDGTVTTDEEASGFPKERLFDRYVHSSKQWKGTTTGNQNIVLDCGAATSINSLVVCGHNLSGTTIDWQYSSDNFVADTNDMVTQFVQGNNNIIVSIPSAQSARYWRLRMTSVSAIPQIAEIFMGTRVQPTAQPLARGMTFGKIFNISRQASLGGITHYLSRGDARRSYRFNVPAIASGDLSEWQDMIDAWAGNKPFPFRDSEGDWIIAELLGQHLFQAGAKYALNLELQEVL